MGFGSMKVFVIISHKGDAVSKTGFVTASAGFIPPVMQPIRASSSLA